MKKITYLIATLIVASLATSCGEDDCVLYIEHFTYRNATGHAFTVFDYTHTYEGKLITKSEHLASTRRGLSTTIGSSVPTP